MINITEGVDDLSLSDDEKRLVYKQIALAERVLEVLHQTLRGIRNRRASNDQIGWSVPERDAPVADVERALSLIKGLRTQGPQL